MLNEQSIQACAKSCFGPFCKPLYDSYCFSRIPATVLELFGIPSRHAPLPQDAWERFQADFVILILIDGFGWNAFERERTDSLFLQRFTEQGRVSKLTSQFPSTTTPHAACIHTGLSVGQTGLYEWFCYDPLVDAVICPLQFSYVTGKKGTSLADAGFDPKKIFDFPTLYNTLKQHGVSSYVIQPKDITNTPFSKAVGEGAELLGYKSLREGLNKLFRAYSETPAQKAYFFFYYPQIDSHGHEFGPEAKKTVQEIMHCLSQLEYFYQKLIKALKPKTSCIVTADHGMTAIDPNKTIFLNIELPKLSALFQKNKQGIPIVPCGSCRDFFLHVQPEFLETVEKELRLFLQGKVEVYRTSELIQNGIFGIVEKPLFERLGNLVLLPHAPYSIWWYDKELSGNPYHGFHGGLSREELEIPFLYLSKI